MKLKQIINNSAVMLLIWVLLSFPYHAFAVNYSEGLPISKALGAWQNPNIGFVFDAITDVSDIEDQWNSFSTLGINVRSAELAVSASIDPFASLHGNFNFSEHGSALHEGYVIFPTLPMNLKVKAGHMLANFGRWNSFHTHAMPFVSEPRIYMEYFGGHFSSNGAEFSWLMPIDHYFEITLAIYEKIAGHTHDEDPERECFENEADRIAFELGYTKHGNHFHTPDGRIIYPEELVDPLEPTTESKINKGGKDLAFGGRMTTSFEFGLDFSLDMGCSFVHHAGYKYSQRIDDYAYPKTVLGADMTLFWHPLTQNRYRNLDLGIEYLANLESFERVTHDLIFEDEHQRDGLFAYLHYQHNPTWHYGCYSEHFYSREGEKYQKIRSGVFLSYHLSHFQFFRMEYSHYKYSKNVDPMNRFILQYDAVIGYHTHGRQR
jgi:hypothetical protein